DYYCATWDNSLSSHIF
nr:immunoglobulin light chain junction region [Macaca mulatta]